MTAQPVRAVYEQGRLRLLDPVDLTEGQEVNVTILSERDRAIAALSDILMHFDYDDELGDDIDEAALLAEISAEITNKDNSSFSDAIIEERREGP
jgi:predicted DNA-binding antitoxin AbrB/MazE fold protein